MFAVLLVQPKPSSHKTPLSFQPSVSPLQVSICFRLSWAPRWRAEKWWWRVERWGGQIKGRSPGCVGGSLGPRGFLIWGPLGGGGYCSPQRYCSGLGTERRAQWGRRWRAWVRVAWARAWHCGGWLSCAWWERRPPHRCRLWGEYGAQSPLSGIRGGSWSCGSMFATRASPAPHRGRWSCGMHSPPGSGGRKKGQGNG